MRTPRDVFIYATRLREVREIQDSRAAEKEDVKPPTLSPTQQRELDEFKSGTRDYRDLSMEVGFWLSIESMNEQRKAPFFYSDLPVLLEQETWAPKDAMLILAGIDPAAAILDWSYENFMGAEVEAPKIRHASWFACSSDLYDWPVPDDFEHTAREIKSFIAEAKDAGSAAHVIKALQDQLDERERWENDEVSKFKREVLRLRSDMVGILKKRWDSGDHDASQRRAPAFYVRWAESRGFEIEWARWAREHDYLDNDPPVTSAPYFDADAEDYPRLLHIGVRAWEHARQTTGGTAKQRIAAYLVERYPDLSASEREAISMIGNWQKTGGRPKTGG